MQKELGIVIKACREHCGYKQIYVAHQLSISVNTYASIENGRVDSTISKLFVMAGLFRTSAHQILAMAEELFTEGGDSKWIQNAVKHIIKPIYIADSAAE